MVYTLLLSFHQMKGKSNPNKSADITQCLYIYEITITTSSSIAVPMKSTCLSPLLVRPFVFDEVSFSFFLSFPTNLSGYPVNTRQSFRSGATVTWGQWAKSQSTGAWTAWTLQGCWHPPSSAHAMKATWEPWVPSVRWAHTWKSRASLTKPSRNCFAWNRLKPLHTTCFQSIYICFVFFLKFSHSFVCANATFDNATAFLLQKDESDSMQFVWSRSSLIFYLAFPEAGAQQCLYTCVLRIWSEIKFSDHPSKSHVEADCNAKGNWIPQCFVFYNSYKNITIFSKLLLSFCMHS